jgi:hypothetical protein
MRRRLGKNHDYLNGIVFHVGPFVSYDCKRAYGWGTLVAQYGRARDSNRGVVGSNPSRGIHLIKNAKRIDT